MSHYRQKRSQMYCSEFSPPRGIFFTTVLRAAVFTDQTWVFPMHGHLVTWCCWKSLEGSVEWRQHNRSAYWRCLSLVLLLGPLDFDLLHSLHTGAAHAHLEELGWVTPRVCQKLWAQSHVCFRPNHLHFTKTSSKPEAVFQKVSSFLQKALIFSKILWIWADSFTLPC